MHLQIPVSSDCVRTLKDPNTAQIRIVHALVQVHDLPNDIPMDPDPRVPKIKGPVIKKISGSLVTDDGRFHLLNRGITLSVRDVEFDNRRNVLKLQIPDREEYGIIDGGHTYRAITESVKLEDRPKGDDKVLPSQYVHLEILVGIERHLADIAEARNFSVQLKAWTLAAYRDKFDWFLEAIGDYRQYVRTSENDDEPVGILDLIQVLNDINPDLFSPTAAPVEAYKNAGKCLENFVEKSDRWGFKKLAPLSRDVLRLYDYIRFHWKDAYNAEDETGRRGRMGARSEAHMRKRNRSALATYYFLDPKKGPVKGDVPVEKGFAIPVVAGFRALLREKNGVFDWYTDPFNFFDEHGAKLVKLVMAYSNDANNDPHIVGRDAQVYTALYSEVRRWYLEGKFAKMRHA